MLLIGDLHGYYNLIPPVTREGVEVVCVGDLGFGFSPAADTQLINYLEEKKPAFRFIRGNHDNPETIKNVRGYIEDGTLEDGVLFIGGAFSIDYYLRTPGLDWWRDEELSDYWWHEFLDNLDTEAVHTVISHDCPDRVLPYFRYRNQIMTRTGGWLEHLAGELPNLRQWFFGHHHRDLSVRLDGVNYECIDCHGYSKILLTEEGYQRL